MMKLIFVVSMFAVVCAKLETDFNKPVYSSLLASQGGNLCEDLKDIERLLPKKQIKFLLWKYLLKDEQYQSVIRVLNSPNAYSAYLKVQRQPEIVAYRNWVKVQLYLCDGSSEESSEEINLFNKPPTLSQSVAGWNGFVKELIEIYPYNAIGSVIAFKSNQNGTFTEYWKRFLAIKPVYERALNFTEVRQLIEDLKKIGVETGQFREIISDEYVLWAIDILLFKTWNLSPNFW